MRSVPSILAVLALALGVAADTEWHFGDTIYMDPTSSETYIKKATYSLVPPAVSTDSTQSDAWLSIWIAAAELGAEELKRPNVSVANGAEIDFETWSNVTITLSAADESFGDSLSLSGATSFGFTSSEKSITWNGDIKFEVDQFPSS
ncbi:hypothetical protein SLS58_005501 [Diplodia intermedia]|uniref:Uncharacterized protein n=1 Tax=Diplodia intermedia TaxID=856260 RepID=A0ABR3TQP8_9PEZI